MTLPNPELALHPTIRRAVFLFGWISVGHYLLRLLSFSFSNTFQFPFVMQIVAESNVPAEEVAWLLAWTEFAMINLFLFFVGVVLYGIILLREVVLLVSGGRAAMHFSLGAHYLFVGCAGALVLIYFIVNSSDAMGAPRAPSPSGRRPRRALIRQ